MVPDPRTGLLLPLTSPSDEGQTSLYTTLAPMPRVVPQQPADAGPKLPLLELVPGQGLPLSAVLRPGTLGLSDALSPVARRSALVPPLGVKPFPAFVNDSETLDLSPSGRYATRNLEQSVAADKKLVQAVIAPSVIVSSDGERSNSDDIPPQVIDVRRDLPAYEPVKGRTAIDAVSLPPEPVIAATKSTAASQMAGSSIGNEPPLTLPTQPIDMSIQELAKIERKREKNRYAAQKCRMLKLERISRLEKRVAELKQQNEKLAGTSGTLRDQVNQLKQLIVQHVEGGCQIMTVRSLQATS